MNEQTESEFKINGKSLKLNEKRKNVKNMHKLSTDLLPKNGIKQSKYPTNSRMLYTASSLDSNSLEREQVLALID